MSPSANIPLSRMRIWLAGIALTTAFAFYGSRGIYETSEGRYCESGREMAETGNYMAPTLNYQHHWTKPPMTYWAIATGITLLGPNERGARLVHTLAFFLTILLVARLGGELFDPRTGLLAGLIYATSPFPIMGASIVTTDNLLALFEIAGVYAYHHALRAGTAGRQKYWMPCMWLCLGAAFLTKGPPALLPLLPIMLWHRRQPATRPALFPITGLAGFALVGLSWFIMAIHQHPGLLKYYVGTEIVDRIASDNVHNYQWYKPLTIYLPMLAFGSMFWSFFIWREFMTRRRHRLQTLWATLAQRHDGAGFLGLWLAAPLLVLCLSRSRLEFYALPFFAPVAIATARIMTANNPAAWPLWRNLAIASAIVLTLLRVGMAYTPDADAGLLYRLHYNDMRPLAGLCREHSDTQTLVATDQSRLFGLQFYLGEKLTRVSFSGKEPHVDSKFRDFWMQLAATPRPNVLFITETKRMDRTAHMLKRFQIPYTRHSRNRWTVFRITQGKQENAN